MMAANKWSKWVVGISSVFAFTGFLYMTQKENPDSGVSGAIKPEVGGLPDFGGAAGGNGKVNGGAEDSKVEVFLFEADKMEQIMKWPSERKSNRERLLESLNWESDPDAEITIPALPDRTEQRTPRSNLRTRRS
jgi:hypothetical protein